MDSVKRNERSCLNFLAIHPCSGLPAPCISCFQFSKPDLQGILVFSDLPLIPYPLVIPQKLCNLLQHKIRFAPVPRRAHEGKPGHTHCTWVLLTRRATSMDVFFTRSIFILLNSMQEKYCHGPTKHYCSSRACSLQQGLSLHHTVNIKPVIEFSLR